MADAASITIELEDKITGPAKRMNAALKSLNTQMAKFNKVQRQGTRSGKARAKATTKVGLAMKSYAAGAARQSKQSRRAAENALFASKATATVSKATTKAKAVTRSWSQEVAHARTQLIAGARASKARKTAMAQLGMQTKKATSGWTSLKESLFGQVTAANLAATAIQALGRAAISAAKWVASSIAAGVKFAESLQFALTSFLGGSERAGRAINKLMRIANDLGLSFEEAGSNFKEFVSAGASEMEAMDLVRFRADMEALSVGVNAPEQISEAFKQLSKAMAIGKFEMEGFESVLRGLPVELSAIMEKLAPKIGKETSDLVDEFGKLKISMTELPVKQTIEAMKEALLEAGGAAKLGEIAIRKQTSTVTGMIDFMRRRLGNVFTELGVKMGPGLQKALLPVMMRLITLLKSPAFSNFVSLIADKMVTGINSAVTAITEFIEHFDEGDPSAIKELATTFWEVHSAISAVTDVFGMAKSAITATFPPTGLVVGILRLLASIWLVVGKAILGVVSIITGALGAALGFVGNQLIALVELITGWKIDTSSLGSSIIDGIINGLKAGAAWVVDTLGGIVDDAVNAVKNKLGIGSPSKVFAQIGGFTMEGFVEGIEGGAPAVASSTAGVLDPKALTGMGGGGTTNNMQATSNATINVSGAGDPEAVAAAVRNVVIGELAGAFEQLNIEISGG